MLSRVLDIPFIYRIWQAPFEEQKIRPVLENTKLRAGLRVLDVGCGPGTNARHFSACAYTGWDIDPGYIRYASSKYLGMFQVRDVTTTALEDGQVYDMILMNSLMHHLEDPQIHRLLSSIGHMLRADGTVEILDLVLPESLSVARLLASLDRGDFARPLALWEEIFQSHFTPVIQQTYSVDWLGVCLWSMVYFKGRKK